MWTETKDRMLDLYPQAGGGQRAGLGKSSLLQGQLPDLSNLPPYAPCTPMHSSAAARSLVSSPTSHTPSLLYTDSNSHHHPFSPGHQESVSLPPVLPCKSLISKLLSSQSPNTPSRAFEASHDLVPA